MKVLQVLNNNVLLVADGKDRQQIIWGKGIGFRLKRGGSYSPSEDDHVFLPISRGDSQWINSFKELASEIPREYFELTESLINMAQSRLNVAFHEHLLIPLTDHIYFAVQRQKQGLAVSNPMLFDIKRFFSREFSVGKEALEMINTACHVTFPDDEAGFIAMHLIEHELSQLDEPVKTVSEALEILEGVNEILGADYGVKFSESDLAVSRMATHLYYLLLRTHVNQKDSTDNLEETRILRQLQAQYPEAKRSVSRIVTFLEENIDYSFTDSDRLFLLIHIIHIIK